MRAPIPPRVSSPPTKLVPSCLHLWKQGAVDAQTFASVVDVEVALKLLVAVLKCGALVEGGGGGFAKSCKLIFFSALTKSRVLSRKRQEHNNHSKREGRTLGCPPPHFERN